VQFSATSQTPAELRHSKVDGRKLSAGQAPLDPLQVSAKSQAPALARHVVPDVTNVQVDVQQELLVPFAEPWSQDSPVWTVLSPQMVKEALPTLLPAPE
jgi:hypothetical protein